MTNRNSVTVVIPGRPPLLNSERSNHWRKHRELTRRYREEAKIELLRQRKTWQRMPMCRVEVHSLYEKGPLPDVAACIPAVKAVIDGAVDAGLLNDDTPDIVKHVAFFAPRRVPGYLTQLVVDFVEIDAESGYANPW